MVVLELVRVAASLAVILLATAPLVDRDLVRQPEPLAAQAARPALLALRALPLLLVDCSGKAVEVVVVVTLALEVLEVPEAVVLAAGVAVLAVAHTPLALVVLAAMAGHWYWSFDYAAICRC